MARALVFHARSDVIARAEREFEALDRLIQSLRPADWDTPAPRRPRDDPWTVRDVIAHIVYWKEHTARGLRGERRPAALRGLGVTAINRHIYLEWRDRPIADLIAWHQQVHADVLRTLTSIPEERFSKRAHGPWWPGDLDGHSAEHRRRDIEAVIGERGRD